MSGKYGAQQAALGARTLKTGQSRWFVGYKKHTLRLWLSAYEDQVLLVPLVSWLAPANVAEGGLLAPSLRRCERRWSWCPDYVIADMGYIAAAGKRRSRENWNVAVLTRLRSDMKLVRPFESERTTVCHQGQPIAWLGFDQRAREHWFGVTEKHPPICSSCWEQDQCPRQFSFPADLHETLLGRLPLSSRATQYLLQKVRPWIEPAQSYEKNQLGLDRLFLNSLRLAWYWGLLADAICILRAKALRSLPPRNHPLAELLPEQLTMNFWDAETPTT